MTWRQQERARNKLTTAIARGTITRPSGCSECGKTGKVEGHHFDYRKALDVEWLCRQCHAKRHPVSPDRMRRATFRSKATARKFRLTHDLDRWLKRESVRRKIKMTTLVELALTFYRTQASKAPPF